MFHHFSQYCNILFQEPSIQREVNNLSEVNLLRNNRPRGRPRMRRSPRPRFLTAAVGSSGSNTTRERQRAILETSPLRVMHIHKMYKRMHKKHGGPPPPGMFHGMTGMWHHMMPKPHEMWHHMMPKPHEVCPPHMMHKMGHHKLHSKFQKMQHKMQKKHHKKHHGRPSSSSSSSSSESEDESLVEGIDKVQIGDEQQDKETGNETPATPADGMIYFLYIFFLVPKHICFSTIIFN